MSTEQVGFRLTKLARIVQNYWDDNQSWLSLLIKVGILIALCLALYLQVIHRQSLIEIKALASEVFASGKWSLLIPVILLIPLNWGFEAEKWRCLIVPAASISRLNAIRAVLGGVMLGLFTPNRVGEFGGRVMFIPKGSRLKAIPLSLIGSYAQIIITLFFGIIAGLMMVPDIGLKYFDEILVIAIALLAFLLIIYYRFLPIIAIKLSELWKNGNSRFLLGLSDVKPFEFSRALLLSALRYAVFTAQYLILLNLYGVHIGFYNTLSALGLIFLVQSLLPTFAVVELLRRGSIAVFFLGFFGANEIAVLAASTTLWMLNLVLPAIVGYVLLLGNKSS
ncbi:MAG: hypothetical protein ACI959_001372 [Limisphaerales bacterium]|jgi:hypothetical protein